MTVIWSRYHPHFTVEKKNRLKTSKKLAQGHRVGWVCQKWLWASGRPLKPMLVLPLWAPYCSTSSDLRVLPSHSPTSPPLSQVETAWRPAGNWTQGFPASEEDLWWPGGCLHTHSSSLPQLFFWYVCPPYKITPSLHWLPLFEVQKLFAKGAKLLNRGMLLCNFPQNVKRKHALSHWSFSVAISAGRCY